MPIEPTTADYNIGDVVQHVFWGRYATVERITHKYLWVKLNLSAVRLKWQPASVRKVD